MNHINFIVEGSPDTAADHAFELKQYLQSNWDTQEINTGTFDKPTGGSVTRSGEFDVDLLKILVTVYGSFKLVVDTSHDLLETRKKLEDLAAFAEKIFTLNHEYLWLQVGDVPYPIKAENLDEIIEAMRTQEQ